MMGLQRNTETHARLFRCQQSGRKTIIMNSNKDKNHVWFCGRRLQDTSECMSSCRILHQVHNSFNRPMWLVILPGDYCWKLLRGITPLQGVSSCLVNRNLMSTGDPQGDTLSRKSTSQIAAVGFPDSILQAVGFWGIYSALVSFT